jgi:DNA mismatch endonuclease, patch repair protein
VDFISRKRRSENMRRIKSKGMKPELIVRSLVHRMGYRYRLHLQDLPGKPDLVFAGQRKIIEVRGCFWHQHSGCPDGHVPRSHINYWRPKLNRNKERDRANSKRLRARGWRVLVIWECEIGDKQLSAKLHKFLDR